MYVFIAIRKQKLAGSLAAAAVSVACAGAARPPSASSLWGRRARASAGVLARLSASPESQPRPGRRDLVPHGEGELSA